MATSRKQMTEDEWDFLRQIGEMFKDARVQAGLTQKEAARAVGTSQARFPVLENGQADVMITTLMRWADIYGCRIEVRLIPDEEESEFDAALREALEELNA